jgi:hypothetical protein
MRVCLVSILLATALKMSFRLIMLFLSLFVDIRIAPKALHNDRLMHMAENMASYRSDLNPEDEIDLLLLEQELTMQSNLLKEAILEAGESIGRPPQAMDIAITVHNSKPIQVEETDNQESIVGSQLIYATKQEVYNSYLSY